MTRRVSLLPYEAAWLLQVRESAIRGMVAKGDLLNVSHDRWLRLDPLAVSSLIGPKINSRELSPLARHALSKLIAGEIRAPRALPDHPPAPLLPLLPDERCNEWMIGRRRTRT
jgi:hypothetical protein